MASGFVDTHLHLEELGDDREVVEQAVDAGVTDMIAVGVDLPTSRRAIELADVHGEVWAAVGHYPEMEHEPDIDALRALARRPRVVAVGEVGLDFASGPVERSMQVARLDALFGLAVELDLPVSVHNRGAEAEIAKLIAAHAGIRGAMHFFALGWEWAERFLDLGFYLSFAGLVTRPSRSELREVVERCPADRVLLESDSPYGNAHKRMGVPNRPAYLPDTAELVAELRGTTMSALADLERENALRLFTRIKR